VDKNIAKKSKKELKAIIKAEKDAYKAQEADDRSKVLTDVTKDQKLKKAETVDKSKLPDKAELTAQIKAEKQGKKIDDAQSAVIADVTKGEKKLKKAKTNDKSKAKKSDLAAQLKSEKEGQTRDEVLDDISEGDYRLKKTETVDKSKLPDKAEMVSQIKAEKAAAKLNETQAAVLADVVKETKLKKVETKEKKSCEIIEGRTN